MRQPNGGGGKVVVLNGASSAGKSTLARAIQAQREAAGSPWLIFSWDDFVPRLPDRWRAVPLQEGDLGGDGCAYTPVGEGSSVTGAEALLVVGDVGRRVLSGYHRAVAALAHSGVHVLVEEVLITAWEWRDWTDALDGIDARWVGVRCNVDEAVRREGARDNRYAGLALGTTNVVHLHPTYDLEVDSTSASADALAAQVVAALGLP